MELKVRFGIFESAIARLEAIPVRTGKVLFYGSSTFTKWGHERLEAQMQGLGETEIIVNHGFGGSTAEHALYYYPRMVRPYAPRALVWYEGDNDIMRGYTSEEAFFLSQRVFEWARYDFPDIKLYFVSVKYSPSREQYFEEYANYNRLLKQYTQRNDNSYYIDIDPMLYEKADDVTKPKKLRTDIYLDDMLHFNDKGYEELSEIIRSHLMATLYTESD